MKQIHKNTFKNNNKLFLLKNYQKIKLITRKKALKNVSMFHVKHFEA